MNKNIKFINLNDNPKIKIICYHTDEITEFINSKNKFIDPDESKAKIKIDYALANNDTFFIILNKLFDKILLKYKNSENFTININTMVNNFNQNSDVVYKIPFKSIKEIFINSTEILIGVDKREELNFYSTFKAFTRTYSKDILEYIVNFSFINSTTFNMNFKIRKHLYNKNKYIPGFDLNNFYITYQINNFKEYTLSNIFNYIVDSINNVTRLLDYKRRDKEEKDLYDNIESNILYNADLDNIDITKTIIKQGVQSKEKIKGSIFNSHEIFKQEYFNSDIDIDKDMISIIFSVIDKEKLIRNDIEEDKILIDLSSYYGINRQNLDKNKNLGTIVTKCINLIKLNNLNKFPVKYKIILGIDIKQRILNYEISLSIPEKVKQIITESFDKSIINFSVSRLIDLKSFFEKEKDEELLNLIELEKQNILSKEIIDEINNMPGENINELANIVLNKNILYKIFCDIYKITDLWKMIVDKI